MKKHPIPRLNKKKWETIQSILNDMSKLISNLLDNSKEKEIRDLAEKLSINMGLLDVELGRMYSLRELEKEFKELKKVYNHGKCK